MLTHLVAILAATTLHLTVSPWLAKNLSLTDPCGPDSLAIAYSPRDVELWYAYYPSADGRLTLLRTHRNVANGPDTFQVPTNIPTGWFVRVVNAAGPSCWASTATGIPNIGVPPRDTITVGYAIYDLSGRRVRPPLPSGVYFRSTIPEGHKRIVVVH